MLDNGWPATAYARVRDLVERIDRVLRTRDFDDLRASAVPPGMLPAPPELRVTPMPPARPTPWTGRQPPARAMRAARGKPPRKRRARAWERSAEGQDGGVGEPPHQQRGQQPEGVGDAPQLLGVGLRAGAEHDGADEHDQGCEVDDHAPGGTPPPPRRLVDRAPAAAG